MASVFSCYVTRIRYASDPSDQLTQSPRVGHDFYSPYHIPDSSLTVKLIRLLIATIVHSRIRDPSHPFMESWRLTPTYPGGNQGGFYDILQQVATGSSHAGVLVGHRGYSRAE